MFFYAHNISYPIIKQVENHKIIIVQQFPAYAQQAEKKENTIYVDN